MNASHDPCDSTDQITSPMVREELDERPVAPRRPAPVKAPPTFTWPLASAQPREPVARKPPVPAQPVAVPAIAVAKPVATPGSFPIVRPAEPAPEPRIVAPTPRYAAELPQFGASVLNARRGRGKLIAAAIIVAIGIGAIAVSALGGSAHTRPVASEKT